MSSGLSEAPESRLQRKLAHFERREALLLEGKSDIVVTILQSKPGVCFSEKKKTIIKLSLKT